MMTEAEVAAFRAGFNACYESMAEVTKSVAQRCYEVGVTDGATGRAPFMTGRLRSAYDDPLPGR